MILLTIVMSCIGFVSVESASDRRVVDANNRFALDLFRTCSQNGMENLVFSPFSISMALAMVYGGTARNTRKEMQRSLHYTGIDDRSINVAFYRFLDELRRSQNSATLSLANKLFAEESYEFDQSYLDLTRIFYEAELQRVDFRYGFDGAREIINRWVEEKTESKIKDLIPVGVLDDYTRLVLANAIYFKGDWKKKFDKKQTKDRDFHTSTGKTLKLPFMYMREDFLVGRNKELECNFLKIPYASKELSMYIYLPFGNSNLTNLENKLSFEHFSDVNSLFEAISEKIDLYIPRFKLESALKLKDALSVLGIKDLFTEFVANLSKMTRTNDLYMNDVLHKAFIDVNEEGSEAAAATAAVISYERSFRIIVYRQFVVDHPFIFLIKHQSTNSVLFMGKFEGN